MFFKLLRGHGRHSSRPPDKSKSDRDKSGSNHRANGTTKVATESTEVQCDASSNPESSPFLRVQDELLSKVPGAESDAARRVHEENLLLQQELKEKCDLLSKLEEELDHRDDATTALEVLERTATPLSLNHRPQQREELRVTQEALSSLRQCFRLDDPYQHTLDTIEQSLCTLLERVTCMEKMAAASSACPSTGSLSAASARRLNFDSTGDPRRLPITTLEDFPGYRIDPPASLGHCSQPQSTKVIYYTERSVTPFLSAIPKRLSDIRLRDFKVVFDRPGQYRYHFKTLDPEFGMVKEEVLHDDDHVPGWDGKIVAWIEEDI
uniref:Diz domain-containing protein ccd n=1 Tax=Rhipicephalus appendiculatus TaxID=34631 RepID=A0A131Z0E8_RHIAP